MHLRFMGVKDIIVESGVKQIRTEVILGLQTLTESLT